MIKGVHNSTVAAEKRLRQNETRRSAYNPAARQAAYATNRDAILAKKREVYDPGARAAVHTTTYKAEARAAVHTSTYNAEARAAVHTATYNAEARAAVHAATYNADARQAQHAATYAPAVRGVRFRSTKLQVDQEWDIDCPCTYCGCEYLKSIPAGQRDKCCQKGAFCHSNYTSIGAVDEAEPMPKLHSLPEDLAILYCSLDSIEHMSSSSTVYNKMFSIARSGNGYQM